MRDKRSIRGLLIAQFFGAFNDNAWKLLVALLGFEAVSGGFVGAAASEAAFMSQATRAFAVFTLPLMLFSVPAGVLSDRFSKRSVILAMKVLELVLMAAGTAVLYAELGTTAALVVLGLMGLQSALFSPAKYGILPEILPHAQLSESNARLEMWTFLAIVGGTAAGGLLLDAFRGSVWVAGLVLTAFSAAGVVAAIGIPRVPAARSSGGLVATTRGAVAALRADRTLLLTVLGHTFFWAMASLLMQVVLVYGKNTLDLGDTFVAVPLAVLVVGMGLGSRAAGRLSRDKVELGLAPLGALLLATAMLVFGAWEPGRVGTGALLVVLGLASGLLLVPLDASLQWRAPADRRGAVIALANVFAFGGVLAGSLAAQAMSSAGSGCGGILTLAGLFALVATAYAVWLSPIAFLRMVAVVLTSTVYRLRVHGRANVPATGGALLVPNHVSFIDGLLIGAALDRPVRFVIDADWFSKPWVRAILEPLGAIPIPANEGPKATLRALQEAGKRLDDGELVCIFAEGQITRTGTLLPFKRGLERILKGRDVPVVPVWLHGVWGSVFSFAGGRFGWKLPRRVPYPVAVAFGEPMPPRAGFGDVRRAVQDLSVRAFAEDPERERALHAAFVRTARRRPFAFAFSDVSGARLRALRALAGSVAIARALRAAWTGQRHVGVLLPPCVPGALVNIAASLAGRTAVNLNYTTGDDGIASAIRQADLRTVVTSRTVLERLEIGLPRQVEVLLVEDVAGGIGRRDRWRALLLAAFAPLRRLERACGAERPVEASDVATVIFSSGSTGEPKGVMLTHANVTANADGVAQVLRVDHRDRLVGILPLFHSFGFTGLWTAARIGMGIAFCPNPLDAAAAGAIVQRERCTVLIATPTFLQLYAQRCTPAQFGSLRLVIAGAEKLRPAVATMFEDTFGLRPLEGYGTTECAPCVATSAPDFRAPGFFQPGSRRGSVGQPLPGVAVRIVDPDTRVDLPAGESGLLLVKGPNVMLGYLGKPELSEEVLNGGWYATGDVARAGEDGFLWITDRLSRFSKIAGEMVPHGRVEQVLQELAGRDEQVFAVTAVADPKKGERLAVVHTLGRDELEAVLEQLAASDLPNLFRPRRDDFVRVDALPLLGTGKLDLRALKEIAATGARRDEAVAPAGSESR